MAVFQGILHYKPSRVPSMSAEEDEAEFDAVAAVPRSRTLSATTEYADDSEGGGELHEQEERRPELSPVFESASAMPSVVANVGVDVEFSIDDSHGGAKQKPERPFDVPSATACPLSLQDRAQTPAILGWKYPLSNDSTYEAAFATAAHLQNLSASTSRTRFSSIVPKIDESSLAYGATFEEPKDSSNERSGPSASIERQRRPRPNSPVSEYPADEHAGNEQVDGLPPRKKHKGPQNSTRSKPASIIASTTPIITVRVDRGDAKTFYIHKGQFTKTSHTLKHLLEDLSLQSISLFKLNPAAFAVYVDWLYTNSIDFEASTDQEGKEAWNTPAYAYVLGSELKDQLFRDTVVDTVRTQA